MIDGKRTYGGAWIIIIIESKSYVDHIRSFAVVEKCGISPGVNIHNMIDPIREMSRSSARDEMVMLRWLRRKCAKDSEIVLNISMKMSANSYEEG